MTVGAPSAEFDLDLVDLDRRRDSGVVGPDSTTVPPLAGEGGGWSESDLDRDGLRDRWMMASLGCWTANFKLFRRPPFIRLRNRSSSRTSASGSGYKPISSSDTFTPGNLDARRFRNSGTRATTHLSGMRRISAPTRIDRTPNTRAMAHSPPDCFSFAIEKAAPPTKMIKT